MSDITVSINLKVAKGKVSDNITKSNIGYSMTAASPRKTEGVQNIGTTTGGDLVSLSSGLSSLGYAYFRNLDDTNFVDLGLVVSATFYPFARLLPGEVACVPLGMAYNALYAKADTAAVDLEYSVYIR